ncbi:MAG: saccharopine dehydrogenase NADP-binding domain-containing protein, partial [Deltaproteobacteria bacterium]|nr:saccharopine dehydrogenase NADP-binding domain-containing protein [Deltaproteobacteria bacterium]
MDRTFDLVLFGATGFTGRLVAEHVAARAPAGLRWALAGRNQGKLDDIRRALGLAELPLVDADVSRPESLDALARSTRVVCTTVGPYALHGSDLVAACAAAGTHYCDLTGEPQWVRRMADLHHEQARSSGARIVNCCGYDCIPADLGLLVLQDHAIARHGRPASRVTHYIGKVRGGTSGGTVSSALQIFAEAEADPAIRAILEEPYSLNPPGERQGPDGPDRRGLSWDDAVGAWTAPSVMALIDNRLVRRSHALRGFPYGRDFRWEEVMTLPKGPVGAAVGAAVATGSALAPLAL